MNLDLVGEPLYGLLARLVKNDLFLVVWKDSLDGMEWKLTSFCNVVKKFYFVNLSTP